MKQCIKILVASAVVAALPISPALATTGPFAGPLTNAFLSVDINGGVNASGASTTEGTDSAGVTWSPWGGPTGTGGDNTQLPNNTAAVSSSTISKTFGAVIVTVSLEPTNTAAYASGFTINSRDRANPTGTTNNNDLFRDFIFAATGGGKQGQDFLLVQFSGLTAGGTYTIALYSFDSQNALSMNWTATAPTLAENRFSWWAVPPNGNFTAPADQQTITWASGATAMQAPAVFTVAADNNGVIKLFGYGGDGVTGHNSSSPSYLNGFQIATASAIPPAPAFVTGGIARQPDGNISLTATGAGGTAYRLWATTNVTLSPVIGAWTLLNSGTVGVSPFTITDPTATNFSRRFYRFSSP